MSTGRTLAELRKSVPETFAIAHVHVRSGATLATSRLSTDDDPLIESIKHAVPELLADVPDLAPLLHRIGGRKKHPAFDTAIIVSRDVVHVVHRRAHPAGTATVTLSRGAASLGAALRAARATTAEPSEREEP